jgi:hypothetical protein
MIIDREYLTTCQNRFLILCEPSIPIYDKNYGTCLSDLFYGRETVHSACRIIILSENFEPLFIRVKGNPISWT